MASLAELVSIRTHDKVLLHGALYEPDVPTTTAVLLLHGSWGNFYTGLGRFLPAALATAGIACLSLNTRGHDYGTVADREPCIGMMREMFKDCPKDISAGLGLLRERGYRQVALIGHSLGAQKLVYSQVVQPDSLVRTVILCSPGLWMSRLAEHYMDVSSADRAIQEATRLVESGHGERLLTLRHEGPVPVVFTAQVFLSVWGPDTVLDVGQYIGQLRTPTMIVVCDGDHKLFRERARALFQLADKAEPRELVVLPKGEHYYLGAEDLLQEAVLAWLSKLGLR